MRLRDLYTNLVSQAGVTVNMAATGLLGDLSVDTDASGIATFTDLHFNIAGTKSLQASSTGLASATSSNFVISAAAAAQLGFSQQPTNTVAGVVISPDVTVQLQDPFGNAVSGPSVQVDLILGGTGTLLGTTQQMTNGSGVATFNNLNINEAGLKSLQADSARPDLGDEQ